MPRTLSRLALATLVAVLPACGGGDTGADTAAADTALGAAAAAEQGAPAGADTGAATLGEADLDAYERALAAEVEVLREAVAKRSAAKTQADSIDALFAATEMQSVPAAAERAGIDADRYRRLDDAFGRVLSARAMNPGMNAMMSEMQNADTSFLATMPAAQADSMRARMKENMGQMQAAFSDSAAYAALPPSLRDTFRERATSRLDSLWRERMELRARAAGMAR
ncbi:MAG TPA: hypothetical protein VFX39_09580 [Gemmatimonadaceae bacterium]|nr:hypothetical protein [Gemmatimonadaceae bacterium]